MTDHDALAALLHKHHIGCLEPVDGKSADPGDDAATHANDAAIIIAAGVRVTGDAGLREALDRIRDITKPLSMTMQGPRWMSGDGDIFGGGNREKVWRIADAALTGDTPEADR